MTDAPITGTFSWSDAAIDTAAQLLCSSSSLTEGECMGPVCFCWPWRRSCARVVLSAALEAEREAARRAVEAESVE